VAGNIYLPILSTFNGAGVKQAQGALAGLAGTVRSLGASADHRSTSREKVRRDSRRG